MAAGSLGPADVTGFGVQLQGSGIGPGAFRPLHSTDSVSFDIGCQRFDHRMCGHLSVGTAGLLRA